MDRKWQRPGLSGRWYLFGALKAAPSRKGGPPPYLLLTSRVAGIAGIRGELLTDRAEGGTRFPPFRARKFHMYAVIKTGGKQYRVSEGQRLRVERLPGNPGDSHSFEEVLLVGGETPKIGRPLVSGASVSAEILSQDRGKKIIVFKLRRRKNYRRKQGHRQPYTELKITGIKV